MPHSLPKHGMHVLTVFLAGSCLLTMALLQLSGKTHDTINCTFGLGTHVIVTSLFVFVFVFVIFGGG